jgi:AMP nucleosidase
VHFAVAGNPGVSVPQEGVLDFSLARRVRRAGPGDHQRRHRQRHADALSRRLGPAGPLHRAAGGLQLARLSHYTATDPVHFQNHVLFTNYQFYVDEFEAYARADAGRSGQGYTGFVATGKFGDHHAGRGSGAAPRHRRCRPIT